MTTVLLAGPLLALPAPVEAAPTNEHSTHTVRVRLSFHNEEDLDYQVDVDISAGSEIARLETVGCPQCVDDDLLVKVNGQASEVTAAIEKARDAGSSTTEPSSVDDSEPAPIGSLGIDGIDFAAQGLGATIAGTVELSRGKVYDPEQDPVLTFVDHRPPGAVLLGVAPRVRCRDRDAGRRQRGELSRAACPSRSSAIA